MRTIIKAARICYYLRFTESNTINYIIDTIEKIYKGEIVTYIIGIYYTYNA